MSKKTEVDETIKDLIKYVPTIKDYQLPTIRTLLNYIYECGVGEGLERAINKLSK